MNVRKIIEHIESARKQGVQVAIELPREGFWVAPEDKLEDWDGMLYWEHLGGRTFLVPPGMIYLRFAPVDTP